MSPPCLTPDPAAVQCVPAQCCHFHLVPLECSLLLSSSLCRRKWQRSIFHFLHLRGIGHWRGRVRNSSFTGFSQRPGLGSQRQGELTHANTKCRKNDEVKAAFTPNPDVHPKYSISHLFSMRPVGFRLGNFYQSRLSAFWHSELHNSMSHNGSRYVNWACWILLQCQMWFECSLSRVRTQLLLKTQIFISPSVFDYPKCVLPCCVNWQ